MHHTTLRCSILVLLCFGCDGTASSDDAGPPALGVDAGAPSGDAGEPAVGDDAGPPPGSDAGPRVDAGVLTGDPEVSAAAGTFRGRRDVDVDVFLGIPYAESTAGARRFTRPVARAPIPFLDATEQGPGCPRRDRRGAITGVEDCLELNVWRPVDALSAPRDVMVFIHGGAFITGTANDPIYQAEDLAREGVVVVTIEYRIGALGWLVADELFAEDPEGLAGNYGLRDVMLALRWVQENIAAFGGNPGNVTVFGESAGAMVICGLLATPSSDGLYHRAIMESAAGCQPPERAESLTTGSAIVAAAGCAGAPSPIACMRGLAPTALLDAAEAYTGGLMDHPRMRPFADGTFLRSRSVASPAGVHVPLLVGTNLNEGDGFVSRSGGDIQTAADFQAYLADQYGAQASAVAALYPPLSSRSSTAEVQAVLGSLWTDMGFRCAAINLAQTHTTLGPRTYLFEFRRQLALFPGTPPLAAHGYELFYVFNHFPGLYRPDMDDNALSADMQSIWVDFAQTADIDATVPAFNPGAPRRLVLDAPVSSDDPSTDVARCDALAALGLRFGT